MTGADGFVVFPAATSSAFADQLGAAEFLTHVGPLLEAGTVGAYGPKVADWYEWNRQGGYNPHEVVDGKVCAFAGWLGWGRGKDNSSNKALNAWTSALNAHFDAKFQVRPFNTHFVTRLKKRFHDAQLARTMASLAPGALLPKEARVGLPPSGIATLWWAMHRAQGVELHRLLLMTASLMFLVRPATVWAFQEGDFDVLATPCGRIFVVLISRDVKRHPELKVAPDRREIEVPLVWGHPLLVWAYALFRARREDRAWETLLGREAALQRGGSAKMSEWLRAACPPTLLRLPEGRRLSSYSLRIAGVSGMRVGLHVEAEFVMRWGLWRSLAMVDTYTETAYGRGAIVGRLFSWAGARQFQEAGVFVTNTTADGAAAAFRGVASTEHGDTSAAAVPQLAPTAVHILIPQPGEWHSGVAAAARGRRRRLQSGH